MVHKSFLLLHPSTASLSVGRGGGISMSIAFRKSTAISKQEKDAKDVFVRIFVL